MTKSEALRLEYRIKQLPVDQKISKLKREENEMTIVKDLKALQNNFKALEKKMEKLIAEAGKSEKPKVAKKTTAKSINAKTTKRAPVKKAPAKKNTAQPTATDEVLGIIKRSKKGVNTATLMAKTGFDLKKVRNILQRTFKQGKIKRVEKGIYVGA
jgi:lambda repressor-like predicted transcriptional regulator